MPKGAVDPLDCAFFASIARNRHRHFLVTPIRH
jgi:hypothetical protein